MHTVAIRRFPDVYGSYTEVHGAYKELYGSFFIRVLRDEKLCGFNFSPGHAGSRRIMPDHAGCLPGVYTDDAGAYTDHPGS